MEEGLLQGTLHGSSRRASFLREDGGLTIAKGVKLNVEEPHLEEPPILPELEAEVEDDEPGTPTRRVRKKSTLKMMTVEDDAEPGMYFEEMDARGAGCPT